MTDVWDQLTDMLSDLEEPVGHKNRAKAVALGILVLEKYPHFDIGAQHDVIICSGHQDVSPMDVVNLRALGWHWDEERESWRIYV